MKFKLFIFHFLAVSKRVLNIDSNNMAMRIARLVALLIIAMASETTQKGCKILNINNHIKIQNNPTVFEKDIISPHGYIKKMFDKAFLYREIKQFVPEHELENYKNTDGLFKVLFPSAIWIPEKAVYLVTIRILKEAKVNWIYATFFNADLEEVDLKGFIGETQIPGFLPIKNDWSVKNSGPEDMRLFKALDGKIFGAFNMLDDDNKRYMWIYSFENANYWKIFVEENAGDVVIFEKNWVPLIVDQEHIYFLYNFQNTQVIDCTEIGVPCKKVTGAYDRTPRALRGGTSFVQFSDTNYYFSFAFTHVEEKNPFHKFYRPHLAIIKSLQTEPYFELIYTSEPVDFEGKLFLEPVNKFKTLEDVDVRDYFGGIMIVTSIGTIDYDNDVTDILASVADNINFGLKVNGIVKFIRSVIEDKSLPMDDNCAEKFALDHYRYPSDLPTPTEPELEQLRKLQQKLCEVSAEIRTS